MSNIATLFKTAYDTGRMVQEKEHTGEHMDGQSIWKSLENQTGDLKDKDLSNNGVILKYDGMRLDELYPKMDEIFKKYKMTKDEGGDEMNPKSNHFFCQLKNLVVKKSNYNIQINRVMQLGYNAGQLSIFIERNTLPDDRKAEITQLVREYNMLDLNTYVSLQNQNIINSKFLGSLKMTGGNDIYYSKYLKYKSKYMQLKNLL